MNLLKKVISICLVLVLTLSIFSATAVNAFAVSENARYYESIPEKAYATVGEAFKIYYNNVLSLPGLKVVFNIPKELKKSYYDDRIEIKAEMPGDFTISWRVYDSEYVLIDSGEMEFIARDLSLKNLTGIVIGDSTVNAGIVTQTMYDVFEENGCELNLLGTRGTDPYLHEGRSGWTASLYCTAAEQGAYQNAFYNDGFDFTYYMNSQGYDKVDFAIIQLGINDIKRMTLENYSSKKVLSYFENMVSSIREYDSTLPIILGVTIPPSEKVSDFDSSYIISSEFEYRNNIIHFASDLCNHFEGYENVYLSPINCGIDAAADLKDAIHPTNEGYQKIAKQYVATIDCILNKKIVVKAPVITDATNSDGCVVLKWRPTYEAKSYYVLRNDKVLAEISALTYKDVTVESGGEYTYKIVAKCKNGNEYTSKASKVTFIGAPDLSSAKISAKGVVVKWESVKAAEKYTVYRKTVNGSWSKVGTTTGTGFTDKTVKSGVRYIYTVRASKGDVRGYYDTAGISVCYLATPKLSAITNTNSGVKVTWGKVSGAKGYYVYRKTSKNGKWTRVAKVTGTSYADKNVKSGSNYYYTVRAFNGNNLSSYVSSGIAIKYLSTPVLSKAVSKANGVTVTYGKVSGATGYYIYRKTGKGSWKKIATVNGNKKTSYVDKTAQKGVTYTYTVRANNGKYISNFDAKGLTVRDKY